MRWPAALALAALGTGCGGSAPPEPPAPSAPAPAPAPASRIAIASREQYYDIDGSSAGALRDQIQRLGPKDESGKALDALTVWELEWTYHEVGDATGCALRDVQVTLNVTVTLPRWKPPPTAPARLSDSWRTYLEHVKVHETGHRTIAQRYARELFTALSGLRAATCAELDGVVSRRAEEIVAEGRARNRAYDVDTQHGQTQGVVLEP